MSESLIANGERGPEPLEQQQAQQQPQQMQRERSEDQPPQVETFRSLIENGVPRTEAVRTASRETIMYFVQATFWCVVRIYIMFVWMVCLVAVWSLAQVLSTILHTSSNSCDQPLVPWIYSLYAFLALAFCRKTITRVMLCHDPARSPTPRRTRVYDLIVVALLLAWPVVALAMLLNPGYCSQIVKQSTQVLLIMYVPVLLFVFIVPALAYWVVLALVRRGLLRNVNAAPSGFVDALPTVTYSEELFSDENPDGYSAVCPICLENFEADVDKTIVSTPCPGTRLGHAFHKDCLGGWMNVARNCPLCRTDLVEATRSDVESRP